VKFIVDNWMLFSIALISGFMLVLPIIQTGMTQGISTAEAVLMMNREKAVVVDLSEPEAFALGHPVGAINISLGALEHDLIKLVTDKSRPIIFFCQTGGVSVKGLVAAQKLGFTKVYLLGGGLKSWREANLPLQKV
jgi:rhodanese-related sulfurtransferase